MESGKTAGSHPAIAPANKNLTRRHLRNCTILHRKAATMHYIATRAQYGQRNQQGAPMTLSIKLLGSIAVAAISLTACNGAETPTPAPTPPPVIEEVVVETPVVTQPSIVGLAVQTADLSTLVAAVTAAGLVDTLDTGGPFTVFAPVNSAFDALPAGTVDGLVTAEDKTPLVGILTYHVVSGEVMAADLVAAIEAAGGSYTINTVNGATLTASIVDGGVVLTDANGGTSNVTATDVDASNGVVHLINTVLMPAG